MLTKVSKEHLVGIGEFDPFFFFFFLKHPMLIDHANLDKTLTEITNFLIPIHILK